MSTTYKILPGDTFEIISRKVYGVETKASIIAGANPGLSEPFKVIQQYQKNLEKEVETLTKDGKKIIGVLSSVSDNGFEIEESKMVRVEGKKKKQNIIEKHQLLFDTVKSTKIIIKFK